MLALLAISSLFAYSTYVFVAERLVPFRRPRAHVARRAHRRGFYAASFVFAALIAAMAWKLVGGSAGYTMSGGAGIVLIVMMFVRSLKRNQRGVGPAV